MELNAVYRNEFPCDLNNYQDLKTALNDMLQLLEVSSKYSTIYSANIDTIYHQKIRGKDFCDWLYDTQQESTLNDSKKELIQRLKKVIDIDSVKYTQLTSEALANIQPSQKVFIIGEVSGNNYCAMTEDKYMQIKQLYLENSGNKHEFAADLQECFGHIFFHDNVTGSLNTLNNKFNHCKKIIVEHLQALENYYPHFAEHRKRGDGMQVIGEAFHAATNIDCSPQAGRKGVALLSKGFYNKNTNQEEIICCELHTKIGLHGSSKQDRIYFHHGKDGIEGERILVVHIGKHL